MGAFLNVKEIKNKVSILDLLKKMGFSPVKESGGEHFFLSMLREEYTPSLCVNDELGVWYDHGGAGVSGIRSGSVIDFGMAYWYPSSYPEVLAKIVEYSQLDTVAFEDRNQGSIPKKRIDREPRYGIDSIEILGANTAIVGYLNNRGILGAAPGNVYEIYYHVLDEKKGRRNYFASGWPNENGGWEVRNKYFKGCLGHKGMSFVVGSADRLCVFEGYFDFLSWQLENQNDPASVLVLNSLSFLQNAKARTAGYAMVDLFFDHDKAGFAATREFLSDIKISRDCSLAYSGFKDYNEKIVAELKSKNVGYKQLDQNIISEYDRTR
ncbi:hypothetical protein ASU31_00250 [Pedobacter ginsenosidimutans]|uniref:Zinc finger CHC2-type domain-containing protein n=1 Tax=Pedobacter ginsenosidimutans TaxID=687842 RepID=A0A0T5VW22_9SPHI|nr:toprim domain-containing protein [Pedobacter ginsenosidimutans]KRT17764.1 hypothetical protein ASU31_00250 [Pedobacter ginsenosidimutans]